MFDFDPDRPPAVPKDAATVVLLREHETEGVQVFLVRRHRKSRFLGGAHVFPGGKVDPGDGAADVLARVVGRSPEDATSALGEPFGVGPDALALFVAAVRETFEESGILLADGALDEAGRGTLRRELLERPGSFPELVTDADLRLDVGRIHPHARWVTPRAESRRYDTRFFAVVCPPDAEGSPDDAETTEADWWSPDRALDATEAGRISLAPPTLRTVELLREAGSALAFVSSFCPTPPPRIEPVFFEEDGAPVLSFPGDSAHPEDDAPFPGPTRLALRDGRWFPA